MHIILKTRSPGALKEEERRGDGGGKRRKRSERSLSREGKKANKSNEAR